MRHRVAGHTLGRQTGHRKALIRNLIKELYKHERIMTTEAKARAVRGDAEKLITKAKRGVDGRVEKRSANPGFQSWMDVGRARRPTIMMFRSFSDHLR